jgi:hypothetical protein
VEILSLRETMQSLQKIASFLAMTDWNNSPGALLAAASAHNTKKNFKTIIYFVGSIYFFKNGVVTPK